MALWSDREGIIQEGRFDYFDSPRTCSPNNTITALRPDLEARGGRGVGGGGWGGVRARGQSRRDTRGDGVIGWGRLARALFIGGGWQPTGMATASFLMLGGQWVSGK